MRKSGIFILLGVTISLSVFVITGILYFHPIQEARRMGTPISQTLETPVVAQKVETKEPVVQVTAPVIKEIPQVVAPVQEEVRKPEVAKPSPVRVVATTYGEAEPVVVPPPTLKPVVEKLPITIEPVKKLPIKPTPETPFRSLKIIPAPPKMDFLAQSVLPEISRRRVETAKELIVPEVETPAAPPVLPIVQKEPVLVKAPSERIKPEVEIEVRPTRLAPVPVTMSMAVLPPFLHPEPVTYLWTPVTIPEGPAIHVDPVSFQTEALGRRRTAVDEIMEKLIWP